MLYLTFLAQFDLKHDLKHTNPRQLGKPNFRILYVDPLDKVCDKYKDCQACIRERYGTGCKGEFIHYTYTTNERGMVCQDSPNTCERALCRCDLDFAYTHSTSIGSYNNVFSLIFGRFEAEKICRKCFFAFITNEIKHT